MINRWDLEEKVREILDDCSNETLIDMWNTYADEEIYTMDVAINDCLCEEDTEYLIRLGADGFDIYKDYAYKNNWGEWISVDDPFDVGFGVIDIDFIITNIIDDDNDFAIDELRELLDKANEPDEPEYTEEEVSEMVKLVLNDKLPEFVGELTTEVINRLSQKGEEENA